MKPFIIVAPAYSQFFNGVKVLHTLCNELNRLGYTAYLLFFGYVEPGHQFLIYSTPQKSKLFNPQLSSIKTLPLSLQPAEDFRSLIDEAVVVYPESVPGNSLHAPRVVRYLLADPEKSGYSEPFPPENFIMCFAPGFNKSAHRVLTLMFDDPFFNDTNTLPFTERRFDCTYIGKGFKHGPCPTLPKTLLIERTIPADKESLAIILRNTRYLFTWDSLSETNIDALRCGALPVVLRWEPYNRQIIKVDGIDPPYAEFLNKDGKWVVAFDKANFATQRQLIIDHYRNIAATLTQRVQLAAQNIQSFFHSAPICS